MERVNFVADAEILETLISMGIDRIKAENALYNTANTSLDAAVAYVFDNQDDIVNASSISLQHAAKESRKAAKLGVPVKPKQPSAGNESSSSSESHDNAQSEGESENYKMVFLVNTALNMRPGKIAAQVGHATLGLYRHLLNIDAMFDALDVWEDQGEKKIVLKAKNHLELLETQKSTDLINLNTYLVQDAGHTQIAAGSITVLAIFGLEEQLDCITGDMKLL